MNARFFHIFAILASLAAQLLVAGLVQAKPTDAEKQAVQEAERIGEIIYLYDQAAWHSTDALLASADVAAEPGLRGYIILPESKSRLRAVYYADRNGRLEVFRSYSVGRGRSVREVASERGSVLSPLALSMIAARDAALALMQKQQLEICAKATPNTIVLPPDQLGQIAVYVMTPMVQRGRIPVGGHHRFTFAPSGELLASRQFTDGCKDLVAKGNGIQVFVLSHLLDTQPTEVHAFVSRQVVFPLTIGFPDRKIWMGTNGKFEYMGEIEPE